MSATELWVNAASALCVMPRLTTGGTDVICEKESEKSQEKVEETEEKRVGAKGMGERGRGREMQWGKATGMNAKRLSPSIFSISPPHEISFGL